MSPSNQKQAELPRGCGVLPNPLGTAVGFSMSAGGCRLYFMPGVPRELEAMFEASVLPDLHAALPTRSRLVGAIRVFGRPESEVGELLHDLGEGLPAEARLTVQYRASFPEIHVRLVLEGVEGEIAEAALQTVSAEATSRLGRSVFATGGSRLRTSFPEAVVEEARRAGTTVAVLDVSTGGLVVQKLAAVASADEVFLGSLQGAAAVQDLLGGSADPVSAEAVERLAAAIRERFGAGHGLALMGSAPVEGEPSTLWVGVADTSGPSSRRFDYAIDRERWRILAAYAALAQLRRALRATKG